MLSWFDDYLMIPHQNQSLMTFIITNLNKPIYIIYKINQ